MAVAMATQMAQKTATKEVDAAVWAGYNRTQQDLCLTVVRFGAETAAATAAATMAQQAAVTAGTVEGFRTKRNCPAALISRMSLAQHQVSIVPWSTATVMLQAATPSAAVEAVVATVEGSFMKQGHFLRTSRSMSPQWL